MVIILTVIMIMIKIVINMIIIIMIKMIVMINMIILIVNHVIEINQWSFRCRSKTGPAAQLNGTQLCIHPHRLFTNIFIVIICSQTHSLSLSPIHPHRLFTTIFILIARSQIYSLSSSPSPLVSQHQQQHLHLSQTTLSSHFRKNSSFQKESKRESILPFALLGAPHITMMMMMTLIAVIMNHQMMMILLQGNHLGASHITMIVHLRLLETQHCRDFHN